jgi:rhodanese-related sulfurtransferase
MADEVTATERELAPKAVAQLADTRDAELIDVRRDYEFEQGHLTGARWIEMNDLTAQTDSIPRDRPVVFYCRTGNRSGMAADAFREAGYDAHNLAGGITDWAEQGLPLEPEDGSVAQPRPT